MHHKCTCFFIKKYINSIISISYSLSYQFNWMIMLLYKENTVWALHKNIYNNGKTCMLKFVFHKVKFQYVMGLFTLKFNMIWVSLKGQYPLRKVSTGTVRYSTFSFVLREYFLHVNKLFVHVHCSKRFKNGAK